MFHLFLELHGLGTSFSLLFTLSSFSPLYIHYLIIFCGKWGLTAEFWLVWNFLFRSGIAKSGLNSEGFACQVLGIGTCLHDQLVNELILPTLHIKSQQMKLHLWIYIKMRKAWRMELFWFMIYGKRAASPASIKKHSLSFSCANVSLEIILDHLLFPGLLNEEQVNGCQYHCLNLSFSFFHLMSHLNTENKENLSVIIVDVYWIFSNLLKSRHDSFPRWLLFSLSVEQKSW